MKDRPDILDKIQTQLKLPLIDVAVVNAIRWKIGNELREFGLPIIFGSGGCTTYNRCNQG